MRYFLPGGAVAAAGAVGRADKKWLFLAGGRRGSGGRGGSCPFGAFRRLFFLLLRLLDDDFHDFGLGQPEGAAAIDPFFIILELEDALAAIEHIPRARQ